jgi:hypothetical protein
MLQVSRTTKQAGVVLMTYTYHVISTKNSSVIHVSRPIKFDGEWSERAPVPGTGERLCGRLHGRDKSMDGHIMPADYVIEVIKSWEGALHMPKSCRSCMKKLKELMQRRS